MGNKTQEKTNTGDNSLKSGCINEVYQKKKDVKSNSKSKNSNNSSNIKLSEKRERLKESSKISEKAYKEKKISESQKEFMEVNDMSSTQIGREKDQLKKEIEAKQKRLNYLEIYEKIKNEMHKEIKKTLIKESKISKYNITKDNIFKIVKEVTINFYKKKEKNLEPKIKTMVKKDMDNMLELIKNFDEIDLETVLTSQYLDTGNKKEGLNDINLDENKDEDLNNPKKSTNRTKNTEKQKKSQKQENNGNNEESYNPINRNIKSEEYNNKNSEESYKPKRIIKSGGYKNKNYNNNEDLEDAENNKTIVKNSYKNSKINKYSYKLLTDNMNFAIQKGIEEGIFEIEIENNGSSPWPQNKAFLVIDNNKSNLNIQNIELEPLKPGEMSSVKILLNHMDKYKPGKYYIHLDFLVDGKKYGGNILINIEVTENINKIKYKTIIIAFKDYYGFSTSTFSDTRIANVFHANQNFENTEKELFEDMNNKNKRNKK